MAELDFARPSVWPNTNGFKSVSCTVTATPTAVLSVATTFIWEDTGRMGEQAVGVRKRRTTIKTCGRSNTL